MNFACLSINRVMSQALAIRSTNTFLRVTHTFPKNCYICQDNEPTILNFCCRFVEKHVTPVKSCSVVIQVIFRNQINLNSTPYSSHHHNKTICILVTDNLEDEDDYFGKTLKDNLIFPYENFRLIWYTSVSQYFKGSRPQPDSYLWHKSVFIQRRKSDGLGDRSVINPCSVTRNWEMETGYENEADTDSFHCLYHFIVVV